MHGLEIGDLVKFIDKEYKDRYNKEGFIDHFSNECVYVDLGDGLGIQGWFSQRLERIQIITILPKRVSS